MSAAGCAPSTPIALRTAWAIAAAVGHRRRLAEADDAALRLFFRRMSICGMSDIPASRYHSMFGLTIWPVLRSRMRSSNSAKFSEPMTPP